MKRSIILISLLAMLLIPRSGFTDSFDDYTLQQVAMCTDYVRTQVSVTDVSQAVTFTQDTKAVYVENLGTTNEMWVDFDDGVATAGTTDETRIDAGKNRSLSGFKTRTLSIVASTGETTTAQVEACW